MNAVEFHGRIVVPGLAAVQEILGIERTQDAERFLTAIAGQESRWTYRFQHLNGARVGAAKGFFQFEAPGGVGGTMNHRKTGALLRKLCDTFEVEWDRDAIHRAIEGHDLLAVGLARLYVLPDPEPLPTTQAEGWAYYLRNWRPGKPLPPEWAEYWQAAHHAVFG